MHISIFLLYYKTAFSVQCDGCSARSYCGYTTANTGFRLAVAILTIILAVLMFFKVFKDNEMLLYFILLVHAVLWFAASMADAVSLTNATMACTDGFDDSTCYPEIYGTFFSFLESAVLLISHFFQVFLSPLMLA